MPRFATLRGQMGIASPGGIGLRGRHRDVLEAIFTYIDGTLWIDLIGGQPLTLSVTETEYYLQSTYAGTITAPVGATGLINGDNDELWYSGGTPQALTISDLIDNDYSNTFVKYENAPPYHVYMIGIIKSGVVLTQAQINMLSKDFWLWLFWSGTYNDWGRLKDNRVLP